MFCVVSVCVTWVCLLLVSSSFSLIGTDGRKFYMNFYSDGQRGSPVVPQEWRNGGPRNRYMRVVWYGGILIPLKFSCK